MNRVSTMMLSHSCMRPGKDDEGYRSAPILNPLWRKEKSAPASTIASRVRAKTQACLSLATAEQT
jgi:hypothetical protein